MLLVWAAILIASVAHSQTSKDTVCMPVSDALKVLTSARQADVLRERISLFEKDISYMNGRIYDQAQAILLFKQKDTLHTRIIETYIKEIEQTNAQKQIAIDAADKLSKQLKRERTKTRIAAGAGILAVIATVFIIK